MHNNGIISAPVNTDDVSTVLGVASHDVATLCLAVKGNDKFNKNKPYRGTQPEVKSRTVDNHANGTGKFLGNRGETTGYPVYWGMRYPMNTAQQNASGQPRSNLLELCVDTAIPANSTHPNYEYMKPELGTDFCRLDDFVGFQHGVGAFLEAGVSGAEDNKNGASTKQVTRVSMPNLTIYAVIPSDSVGWTFKDIIPEADSYYLVAEFYIKEMYVSKSTAVPGKTVKSSVSLGAAPGMSISFDVPISEVLTALGLSTSTDVQFYVLVGFNKYSGSTPAGSAAFIAPWSGSSHKQSTLVTVQQGSPYNININKYAPNTPTPSESSYVELTTSPVTLYTDTLYFMGTIYNGSSTPLTLYFGSASGSNALCFRARAYGSYGAYEMDNGGHLSAGGTNSAGAFRNLQIGTQADLTNPENNVTIPAGQQKTIYFKADNLIPYGNTIAIMIYLSADGGASWTETGGGNCNFNRIP